MQNPAGFWPLPYQKIVFTRAYCGTVDEGAHRCTSTATPPAPTRLAYVHLHHKGFATQRRMSREKLRPYVDVENQEALRTYRGIGWHLVANLLKTESEYLGMMTGGSVQFPEFPALLERLGIDPGFCDN